MEEPFLPAIVPNESKASVANESLDRTGCHPSRLLGRGRAQDPIINIRSTDDSYKGRSFTAEYQDGTVGNVKTAYGTVQNEGLDRPVPYPVPSPSARTCLQIMPISR